jgi:hypothetical protein
MTSGAEAIEIRMTGQTRLDDVRNLSDKKGRARGLPRTLAESEVAKCNQVNERRAVMH